MENKKIGTVEVSEKLFGARWNPVLVAQVVQTMEANTRQPWAHVKERGEVRGGGKKPWRQKGTGRARHGSIRSPLWAGGGVTHGPRNEKNYAKKINKKMRQAALRSVLSQKFREQEIKVLDPLDLQVPKTKALSAALRTLLNISKTNQHINVLLVPEVSKTNLTRAVSNIKKAKVVSATHLSVYDLINYKNVFIAKDALSVIENHYKH